MFTYISTTHSINCYTVNCSPNCSYWIIKSRRNWNRQAWLRWNGSRRNWIRWNQCGVLCNCTLCPTLMLILTVIMTMSYTVLEGKSQCMRYKWNFTLQHTIKPLILFNWMFSIYTRQLRINIDMKCLLT